MKFAISDGKPFSPGAVVTAEGVDFCLFSRNATAVSLCLFDSEGNESNKEMYRDGDHWCLSVPKLVAGQCYAYRVHGPWAPDAGHRFNPAKIVLDPYARSYTGPITPHSSHYDYQSPPTEPLVADPIDNAPFMPKCVVVLDPLAPRPIRTHPAWDNLLLYELHVKGFTQRHPGLEQAQAGKYTGLATGKVTDYLSALGITSVELLPVHELVDEPFLKPLNLTNYWGYNPIGFFAPTSRYALENPTTEFCAMVDGLHDADIEVILDVVYNHTAEGGTLGPTYSFRGIDNFSYYRLQRDKPLEYINDSGCGNALNMDERAVLRLVLDSLRYWVTVMGVDGFRFDLATGLGRTESGYSPDAAFFQAVYQDPILNKVRLIAEPWDLGIGGYQLSNFPNGWSEWNDRYRDNVRRFWRGDEGAQAELARQVHGSSDLFERAGRTPHAGINFLTSHDGFTLSDLVSYESKHNEANLEDNRDGHNHNYSFNCGVEGHSDDPVVCALRLRQKKNLLLTLLISQGVPMLLAGDEFGRSQAGNNNSYCQDNELSWLDWELTGSAEGKELLEFTRALVSLRNELPELCCKRFIHGAQHASHDGLDEIDWIHPRGTSMDDQDWHNPKLQTIGLMLHGDKIFSGAGNLLFILFNSGADDVDVVLPRVPIEGAWVCRISSADENNREQQILVAGESARMQGQSAELLVFNKAGTEL